MVKCEVLNIFDGKIVDTIDLDPFVFCVDYRADILHKVVLWQRSKMRSGCHKVKQRNEVSGSTRKIYKQKGTGQARHGSIKAPIFIGGGIVFGPLVRSHEYKLNKKIRSLGLRVALSKKLSDQSMIIANDLQLESYKTAVLSDILSARSISSALIVDDNLDVNLVNASRGLINIDVLEADGLNVLDIMQHNVLIISRNALNKVLKRLSC